MQPDDQEFMQRVIAAFRLPSQEQQITDAVESRELRTTFNEAENARRIADIEAEGRREYFDLRKTWSVFLMRALFILLAFQLALVIFVGKGWLNFQPYRDVLDLVIGTTFLQVIGMCVVVVKFLFPNRPD